MAKSKKLTFNMINAILPEVEEHEIVISEEHGMTACVKSVLGFGDAMSFVRSVAGSCFDSNDQYMPELFDFAVAVNIMVYYAGIDEPKDYSKAYRVLTHGDFYNKVFNEINTAQLDALVEAAKRRINHKREELIQANVAKMNELIIEVDRMVAESGEAVKTINSGDFQRVVESLVANVGSQTNVPPSNNDVVSDEQTNVVPITIKE